MNTLAKTTTIIELHVPDFEQVKSFYGDLGFKILWEYPAVDRGGYLMMQMEENMIGFYCGNEQVYDHEYFKKFPKTTVRGYGVEIGIFVTVPIEECYDKVTGLHKANIVEDLVERPWGIRDFRIIDPFGYYIRISEPSDMSKP